MRCKCATQNGTVFEYVKFYDFDSFENFLQDLNDVFGEEYKSVEVYKNEDCVMVRFINFEGYQMHKNSVLVKVDTSDSGFQNFYYASLLAAIMHLDEDLENF